MTHTSTTWLTYCFLPLITSFTFANGFVNTTEMWLANLWLLASQYRTTKIRLRLQAVVCSKYVFGKPVTVPPPLQDYQVAKVVNRRFDLVNIAQRVEES
jgi:hypothetical protein